MSNKKRKLSNKAFSLIEISIVILIIGILVTGITQGSRLVKYTKLSSVRNLTKSSDVVAIKDLVLWLDSTAEGTVFSDQSGDNPKDGDLVNLWKNINPLIIAKNYDASQIQSAHRPTYVEDGINGLPSILLNRMISGNFVANESPNGKALDLSSSFVDDFGRSNAFTIFLVHSVENPSNSTVNVLFSISDNRVASSEVRLLFNATIPSFHSASRNNGANLRITPNVSFSLGKNYITSFSTSDAKNETILYQNGVAQGSPSAFSLAPSKVNNLNRATIGANDDSTSSEYQWYYHGLIAELIIYDRKLSANEIKSVHSYLSKKWGIKLN